MNTAVLVLLSLNLLCTFVLAVFSFKAYGFVTWTQGVLMPWVVKVGTLVQDDYDHPEPPTTQ